MTDNPNIIYQDRPNINLKTLEQKLNMKSGKANSNTVDVLALLQTDTPDSDFVNSKPWVV